MSNNQKETELTQSKLKELLHYDKETGIFTWAVSRARRVKAGDEAGSKTVYGYSQIRISVQSTLKSYLSHRLAWLYEHGEFPKEHIDHINHNRIDNRIANLREVNRIDNQRNQKKSAPNKSGFTGVHWHKQAKKWLASITVNCKTIYLGLYEDKNEAICARLHANRLYQFHANHGN